MKKKAKLALDDKVSLWPTWDGNLCLSDSNACSRILYYHLKLIIIHTHRIIVTLFKAFTSSHVLCLPICLM